ncbi:MAG: DUF3667 domain-containing protein [Bacteroidetes bacterium]|nr:DUF3667 domain-containing protein [Bacteroidota bacterium]
MSHLKERSEKICLNCNAALHGLYCHVCGQENIEPKQSAWHLVSHFFYDVTHFDGKFFTTLKDLLIKPGFLSKEFISGRRISYLHPIRMYIFTSAIFFIVFFSIYNIKSLTDSAKIQVNSKDLAVAKKEALSHAKNREDSMSIEKTYSGLQNLSLIPQRDSSTEDSDIIFKDATGRSYKSIDEYDSIQNTLAPSSRDGWMKKMIAYKNIELGKKYKGNRQAFFQDWLEAFVHNFPKLLFISLPLFALTLKLLYVRRKQFYYADHGIFAIHLYIYSFIALLFVFGFRYLRLYTGWNWLLIFTVAIFLYTVYYFYKAMRNFYQQNWIKTFLKYILLFILSLITIIILFTVFFAFSILQI